MTCPVTCNLQCEAATPIAKSVRYVQTRGNSKKRSSLQAEGYTVLEIQLSFQVSRKHTEIQACLT